MRVALYARVSTDDKDQDPETQLRHLHDFCERRGYEFIHKYVDYSSGRSTRGRGEYLAMMEDARKHKFDTIVAYKLDRLHRRTLDALLFAETLESMKIGLIITSQPIDTTTAAGRAMMQMLMVFAELESAQTSERVKVGMERAKAQGVHCGRPKFELSQYQLDKAKEIIAANPRISGHELAKHFTGIDRKTLLKSLRKAGVF